MSNELIGVIGMLAFMALMFLRIPLGFVFAIVGGMGAIVLLNAKAGLSLYASIPFGWSTQYSFSSLPMFILMGLLISETGMAKDLYGAAYKWLGRLPGGLGMATLVATALFSGISGSAVAAAATIGAICYPEMKRYKYSPTVSSGVIAAGSTMDIMIPPSIPMIIFGIAADVSVGKMFIAGFVPGFLEVTLFGLFLFLWVKIRPSIAPLAAESTPLIDKVKGLKGVIPVVAIFLFVFGGLYGGVFTPTEAGAVGVVASIIAFLALRRLSWRGFVDSLTGTIRLTGVIFMIIIGVMVFNTFIGLSGLSRALSTWVTEVGVSPIMFLVVVLGVYLILGAMMEEISMMLLTIPFYMPAVNALGIDPIYFGILIIVAWQIGLIAPPVGLIAFVTRGVLKDVPLVTVYKGCLPFIAVLVLVEAILIMKPDLVLFMVRLMER